MSYYQPPAQGYNDNYNSMDRTVGSKQHSVMSYPPEMRNVNAPRHFDQRNVDPRDFRSMENNRFPPHQPYQQQPQQPQQPQQQQQHPVPPRPIDPRQAEIRAMEARNAMNPRAMETRPMISSDMRAFDNRPIERPPMDRGMNNRVDPRIGFNNSLPNSIMNNNSPVQSSPPMNPVIGPPMSASSVYPRPSVSDLVQIPAELSAFAAEPKFQQILLRVKEQTLVNFISLNRVLDGVESVVIDASTKEAAQLAKNLIETHLKLQLKVKAAENRLQRVQTDLFSTQGEIAAGQMVEFSIRTELIGLAIGKKGSRIKQIETETGVSSINVNDNGHIMIYGPDSQSVQQAKEQLELVEESFTLQAVQADWLSDKMNSSILADLKKDANLMVARINKDSNSLEVVGTNSSVQLTKFLLATQLEYIDKQIEIEGSEREAREKLYAVRKQYGLNTVPWRNRPTKGTNSNSPATVEPTRKYSGSNTHERGKNNSRDESKSRDFFDPPTSDDMELGAIEDPLEALITYAPADDGKKQDTSKSKRKEKGKEKVERIVDSKQSETKDRKQGKTRTVEITSVKTNDSETGKEFNKAKTEKSGKSQGKFGNSNEKGSEQQKEDSSSLIVIPPPPLLTVPPPPPLDKGGKNKKNKKQDEGKEKKGKEPMLVKINNPFQEQPALVVKSMSEQDDLDHDIPEITFPKKVSGPPKEPPARIVTLLSSVTKSSSVATDQKNKHSLEADDHGIQAESKNDKTDPKVGGNNRNRGRGRKDNNAALQSKVEIISIVRKEQDSSSDVPATKADEVVDTSMEGTSKEGNGSKKSRRRRNKNDKDGEVPSTEATLKFSGENDRDETVKNIGEKETPVDSTVG